MHVQDTAMVPVVAGRSVEKPFRVAQVAEMFDVDPTTIYRDIKAGRLGAYRIGKGRGTVRIPATALAAYKAVLTAAALVEVA